MLINLKEIPVIWINDKSNKKRFDNMNKLLENNFKKNIRIDAVKDSIKYNGVTYAHLISLLKGFKLNQYFIILEDDVNIKYLPEQIEIPDNTDALYLGISTWGNKKFRPKKKLENKYIIDKNIIIFNKGSIGITRDDNFFRIKNMYGAHAILYINKDYVFNSILKCLKGLFNNRPHDVLLPKLQEKYNVLGMKNPIFYQDEKIGGQERETNIKVV